MSREDVRRGIAVYFGGSSQDGRGFYRPSPLKSLGLSGVVPYYNDRFDENRDYTEGLDAGATFGTIMCVHVAATNETRLTIGGTLNRPYNIDLNLWAIGVRMTSTQATQAAFDDLLDAVVARIRTDPTLGMGVNSGAPTIVTQAGEGSRGITVNSSIPAGEPGSTTYVNAVVSFDAATYPNIA